MRNRLNSITIERLHLMPSNLNDANKTIAPIVAFIKIILATTTSEVRGK